MDWNGCKLPGHARGLGKILRRVLTEEDQARDIRRGPQGG